MGVPMPPDPRRQLLEALMAQSTQSAPAPDMPISDQNFQSFFEQNATGGAQGIDRMREHLPQAYHFNMPMMQDPREYKTPEYDGLLDPNWLLYSATRNSY